jgi:uncharacterized membrane protein YdjX (TVP38/TMEM64 family)
LAGVLLVGAALLLRGANPRELIDQGMGFIRAAGPVVFFAAMAILPAAGAPLMAFTLSAGEAFGAQLSMVGVIAVSLTMIALNLALTYWLARYALRPALTNLVTLPRGPVASSTKMPRENSPFALPTKTERNATGCVTKAKVRCSVR